MSSLNHSPSSIVTNQIRFGETYGFCFSGDTVELNATFCLTGELTEPAQYWLQFRAGLAASSHDSAFGQHLIAEAPLPPLSEIANEIEPFRVVAPATTPAGQDEWRLSLVLVSKKSGQAEVVHAVASFYQPERFCAPRISGEVAHAFSEKSARLTVASIENPRSDANLSGSLSLELWALPAAYQGGAFQGAPLGGAILGQLSGSQAWTDLQLNLAITPPPAGVWHVVLMLREWTGSGYTTRDFRNFEQPLLIAPESAATSKTDPVKSAKSMEAVPSVTVAAQSAARISVNRASAAELAAIKGLTKPMIIGIIAGRPYTTIEQIAKVKGVGTKTFVKIRALLVL